MPGRSEARAGEQRILIVGILWLLAGVMIYVIDRHPAALFLPPALQLRLLPGPLNPFVSPFPTFAYTLALSLLCVWWFKCSRVGALVVCAGVLLFEAAFEFGQLYKVSSWVTPTLPDFIRNSWLLDQAETMIAHASFDPRNLAAAALGAAFAYLVVLNSVPGKKTY